MAAMDKVGSCMKSFRPDPDYTIQDPNPSVYKNLTELSIFTKKQTIFQFSISLGTFKMTWMLFLA